MGEAPRDEDTFIRHQNQSQQLRHYMLQARARGYIKFKSYSIGTGLLTFELHI